MNNSNDNNTNKALAKGNVRNFHLIGRAKVGNNTFSLDREYDSGWTANEMYLCVDCGEGNTVFAEMKGGYFPDRDNVIKTFSNERGEDGKSKPIEINWCDRLDESLLDEVSSMRLINVSLLKDAKDKSIYKKFLSSYDAVRYISDNLKNDMILSVRGELKFSEYNGEVSCKKEITSLVLIDNIDSEDNFKAEFTTSILVDRDSLGKYDNERNSFDISAYCVDYLSKATVNNKKVAIKKNITYPFKFEFNAKDKKETVQLVLNTHLKPTKGNIHRVQVVGKIIESASTVTITKDDLDSEMLGLIEAGFISEEEVLNKAAISNNKRVRRFVIEGIKYKRNEDTGKVSLLMEKDVLKDSDLYFYEQALSDAGVGEDVPDTNTETFNISDIELEQMKDILFA